MIGGGVYAYTMLGINYNKIKDELRFMKPLIYKF